MGEHEICLLGGTFDRFHAGHRALIAECLSQCEHVEVWLTSDLMAQLKDGRVQHWQVRKQAIEEWSEQSGFSERISIHQLVDRIGPAPSRRDCTAIACTPETRAGCDSINELRSKRGLQPLAIIEVSHIMGPDGKPISSTRIRDGEIDREGNLWLGPVEITSDVWMPKTLDSELKQPQGILLEGRERSPKVAMRKALAEIPDSSPKLIAVGDVCVQTLVDLERPPDIGLIDGMTKRKPWKGAADLDRSVFENLLTCVNPPGQLTAELKQAIAKALKNDGTTLIVVDGEEDLAPIIVHLLAPIGSAVVYGQPKQGVVLRFSEEESKNNCRRLLDQFTRGE